MRSIFTITQSDTVQLAHCNTLLGVPATRHKEMPRVDRNDKNVSNRNGSNQTFHACDEQKNFSVNKIARSNTGSYFETLNRSMDGISTKKPPPNTHPKGLYHPVINVAC